MAYAYDAAGTVCTGGPQPGALALAKWAASRWDLPMVGIYNCRPPRTGGYTVSLHGEGRAVDLHTHTGASEQPGTVVENALGDEMAEWFVATAETTGVQRVIWQQREWDSRPGERLWEPYGGPFHGNHVHVELSWAAAKALTVADLDALAGTPQEDDMPLTEADLDSVQKRARAALTEAGALGIDHAVAALAAQVAALAAQVSTLSAAVTAGGVDPELVAAALVRQLGQKLGAA